MLKEKKEKILTKYILTRFRTFCIFFSFPKTNMQIHFFIDAFPINPFLMASITGCMSIHNQCMAELILGHALVQHLPPPYPIYHFVLEQLSRSIANGHIVVVFISLVKEYTYVLFILSKGRKKWLDH